MKKLIKAVYLVFGSFAILYGSIALVMPTVLHSESARSFPLAHNLREQGAAAIFMGLMGLWCSLNYDRSLVVHYFLTFFAALLSAIHWHDYFDGHLPFISPLYNTVPFLVFSAIAILRTRETSLHPQ